MNTAKFIKDMKGWSGHASAYELSTPLDGHKIVIVSAVNNAFAHETFIFPATPESLEENKPSDWLELSGSYVGGTDHAEALSNAGYEVIQNG